MNINIIEVYEALSGVQVKNKSKQVTVKSLFTRDTTPSMAINRDKNVFYCHSTGIGGNAFNLIQGKKHLSGTEFLQAKEKIESLFGVKLLPKTPKTPKPRTAHGTNSNYFRIWTHLHQKAQEEFKNKNKRLYGVLYAWLGFNDPELIKHMIQNIGWCDITHSIAIPYHLNRGHVTHIDLVRYAYDKKKILSYPTPRHRENEAHQTLNYDNDGFNIVEKESKSDYRLSVHVYDNRPDTPILICEGVKDALTANFCGYNSVACHGGASSIKSYVNNHYFRLLVNNRDVYILYDSDATGLRGSQTLRIVINQYYLPNRCKILRLSSNAKGYDITDLYRDHKTKKQFRNEIDKMIIGGKTWR